MCIRPLRIRGALLIIAMMILPEVSLAFQAPAESGQASPPSDDSFSPQGPYFGKLVIPDVVRYDKLPMRMHLEPTLVPPKIINTLDDRMVPLFVRALRDATDLEVQTVAAMSLARVAQYEELSIDAATDQILATLRTAQNPALLYAVALAAANGNIQQAAPELLELARKGNDSQKAVIEPALIRWKFAAAKELWNPRLSDPASSESTFRLAAEGMASLMETSAVAPLSDVVANEAMPFGKRTAAARSVAILDPAKALTLSDPLSKGNERSRLLALSLLDSTSPEAWTKAATLCPDPSAAVASNAWTLLLERSPNLLQVHLPIGRTHRDSTVRIAAARTMKLFPTPERCTWLNELLDDSHIHVRNVSRQMLVDIALQEQTLYGQIAGESADNLKMENTNWQGIEQSLILLGQIRATQYSPLCYPLLKYPRDEVSVSAAWLIHLFPDESLKDQLLTTIQDTEQEILKPELMKSDSIFKQQHLIQAGAILRIKEMMPLLEPKLVKGSPGGMYERAAAIWAIGMLKERNPDPTLMKQLEGRIQDRSSIPPEFEEVRRASVMALGLIRAKDSISVVRESYGMDSAMTLIPQTARFLMPILGEPPLPEIPDWNELVGGWKLNPSN